MKHREKVHKFFSRFSKSFHEKYTFREKKTMVSANILVFGATCTALSFRIIQRLAVSARFARSTARVDEFVVSK